MKKNEGIQSKYFRIILILMFTIDLVAFMLSIKFEIINILSILKVISQTMFIVSIIWFKRFSWYYTFSFLLVCIVLLFYNTYFILVLSSVETGLYYLKVFFGEFYSSYQRLFQVLIIVILVFKVIYLLRIRKKVIKKF